jgi:TctA family transporter
MLLTGVVLGMFIGAIPGLSGRVGLALLLPFIIHMEPASALALMVGVHAITNTSDTIPAVLFGVPGTSGVTATILDGYPMAKKGEAERAFGAAFLASAIGGIIGAFTLLAAIPILRPLVLTFGNAELFMTIVLAIVMVALLTTRGAPLKGLIVGAFGLLIGMVGEAPHTGILRWTFDSLYLWEGFPLIPMTLGIFAIPEFIDMTLSGTRIASEAPPGGVSSKWQGVRDVFQNWWLVLRSSLLGTWIGILPGLGSAPAVWLTYSHAVQTSKDKDSFGQGDVRGVIAPEAANNASDSGAFVLTLAFGIPGSVTMALILAALMIMGLSPGPKMLTDHLDLTLVIVWSLILANLIATAFCFAFASQLAKVASFPVHYLFPVLTVVIFVAAYQTTANWGDLFVLVLFSFLGIAMKRLGWPRPPLIVGAVLERLGEVYFFLATKLYGISFLIRPFVIVLFLLILVTIVHALLRERRPRGVERVG